MPNRFTRIPEGAVPELPRAARVLFPLGDAFMILMASRPATGSLRNTWVTPATLWLAVAAVVAGLPASVIALDTGITQGRLLPGVVGALCLILVAGSAAVAAIGGLQRGGGARRR